MTSSRFVRRRGELDEVTARLGAACDGTGQVVLISGEPGIGNTRLAHEIAGAAVAAGMGTCWGRASEDEGSPPTGRSGRPCGCWPDTTRPAYRDTETRGREALGSALASLAREGSVTGSAWSA